MIAVLVDRPRKAYLGTAEGIRNRVFGKRLSPKAEKADGVFHRQEVDQ